jgi:hypothetical protein
MYQANEPAVSHEVVWNTIDELITKVVLEPVYVAKHTHLPAS